MLFAIIYRRDLNFYAQTIHTAVRLKYNQVETECDKSESMRKKFPILFVYTPPVTVTIK